MGKVNTCSEKRKGKVKMEAKVQCQLAGSERVGRRRPLRRCRTSLRLGCPLGQRLVRQAESWSPAAVGLAG